jgi:hypothetical protein
LRAESSLRTSVSVALSREVITGTPSYKL